MSLPYYPMYPRDFFEGTQEMSLELKGAYIMVLNLMYTRGGPISDEAGYISRYIGCSITKWVGKDGKPGLRDKLVAMGKLIACAGMLSNPRADGELTKQAEYQQGRAKNRANSNKDKAQESHVSTTHANTEPEPDIREMDSAQAREPELVLLEADCRKWANGSLVANFEGTGLSSIERLMQPPAGGEPCTRDDVRVGITETASTLHSKGRQVASLEYFEQPILRARDKRLSPLPKVEIIDERAGANQGGERSNHARRRSSAGPGNQHRGNGFISGLALLESVAEAQNAVPDGPEDWRDDRVAAIG